MFSGPLIMYYGPKNMFYSPLAMFCGPWHTFYDPLHRLMMPGGGNTCKACKKTSQAKGSGRFLVGFARVCLHDAKGL